MSSKNLHIEHWRNKLGLFPMPLFRDRFTNEKFVLLNGGTAGNLCIDFNNEDISYVRNYAWSIDVGHYLVVDNQNVSIYRWDTFKSETYKKQSVETKLEGFYNYLRKQELNRQDSIIKFGIQFYRNIRTLLRDNTGNDSLNVLLYLFACVADGNVDRNKLLYQKWSFGKKTKAKALEINNARWEELLNMFLIGLKSKGLQPNIELFLRHASGSLFQEAHFETLFPPIYQQSFEIFIPKSDEILNKKRSDQTSAHFTPISIVRTIVEEAIRDYSFKGKKKIIILDPACGSGEFLKEFVRQIRLKGFKGKIKVIGWDISETAIDMANFVVNNEVRTYNDLVEIKILEKDALQNGKYWNEPVDFLLMNPPFISWELMDNEQRENVSSNLGKLTNKRPNTAGAFLWNAVNCLNNGGIIGCVLPTSIFENDSYISLREEIKNIIDIKIIGRLGSHSLFSDALVDAAIFIGIKKQNQNQSPLILWSDYKLESATLALRELRKIKSGSNLNFSNDEGYSLYENSNLVVSENWMPIPFKSFELLSRFKSFTKVEDIFDVKQGVRTGLNAAFLITKNYFDKLGVKEKRYFRPAITNESILDGRLNDNYHIFYAEGEFEISSEEELKRVVPNFYRDVLKPNFNKLSNRARKGEHNFWKLSEHRAWQIAYTPKIVSKEFGKAGSFAYDRTGAFIAERSHAWLTKNNNDLKDIGYAYITVLAMPIINDFLAGISKQIGGGQWYLSSKYINKMPIPDLFNDKRYEGILNELINLGIQMNDGCNVEIEQLMKISKFIFNV